MCAGSADSARALSSALAWLPLQKAEPIIRRLLEDAPPHLQLAGIIASALHRRHPGPVLRRALQSDNLDVRWRALPAVGETAASDYMPYLQDALRSEDLLCQLWAAALLSWDTRAIDVLRTAVENNVAIPEVGLQWWSGARIQRARGSGSGPC
jgi:HEAT repeat protein